MYHAYCVERSDEESTKQCVRKKNAERIEQRVGAPCDYTLIGYDSEQIPGCKTADIVLRYCTVTPARVDLRIALQGPHMVASCAGPFDVVDAAVGHAWFPLQ